MAPQGTQPHITRASPHLPATSPHSQPRHLACPPLPRTLRRAGEGAAGQVPTPERGRSGRSPSPKALLDLRWGRELGKGVAGALLLQEEASSILSGWNRRRLGSASLPPPLPPPPTAQLLPAARALRGSPNSCPSPQIGGGGENGLPPPHRAPTVILHPPAHLRVGGGPRTWPEKGHLGSNPPAPHGLALWWDIKSPSPAHLPPPVLFGAWEW